MDYIDTHHRTERLVSESDDREEVREFVELCGGDYISVQNDRYHIVRGKVDDFS